MNRDMNSESILSRPSVVLGDCIRPVASGMRARMESRPNRSLPIEDVFGFVDHHLEQITANAKRLVEEINRTGKLTEDADTPESAVHRGVARMEICLEHLLDDYDEVRRAILEHPDSEGRRLLEKVYRETLIQIQRLLDDIVECRDDPRGALEKRGLTIEEGKPKPIRLDLVLEAPPSMNVLETWTLERGDTLIDEERETLIETSARTSRKGTGCLGLLATFGLGWWLGSAGEDGDFDC